MAQQQDPVTQLFNDPKTYFRNVLESVPYSQRSAVMQDLSRIVTACEFTHRKTIETLERSPVHNTVLDVQNNQRQRLLESLPDLMKSSLPSVTEKVATDVVGYFVNLSHRAAIDIDRKNLDAIPYEQFRSLDQKTHTAIGGNTHPQRANIRVDEKIKNESQKLANAFRAISDDVNRTAQTALVAKTDEGSSLAASALRDFGQSANKPVANGTWLNRAAAAFTIAVTALGMTASTPAGEPDKNNTTPSDTVPKGPQR